MTSSAPTLSLGQRVGFKLGHLARVKPRRLALDRGILSIGFDDFPRSAHLEAGPVLRQHGVAATYFASGGLSGKVFMDLAQYRPGDLEEIHAAGHEIGCHGYDHDSVLHQGARRFGASLSRNAKFVAAIVPGLRMQSYAFPYGHVSLSAKRVAARRFHMARGLGETFNIGRIDAAQIASVGLERRRREGRDLEALIAATAQRRGWLTVYTHDVTDRPSDWGCTPRELDDLIRAALAAGLAILPFDAVPLPR